jgi:hypothetical protein
LSEVTTCSRFWTYRLGSKSCRLVHLEHIQDLQEQVGDLELDIQALEGVVGMLQQMHHPSAIGDDEQMEIQLDPEEV